MPEFDLDCVVYAMFARDSEPLCIHGRSRTVSLGYTFWNPSTRVLRGKSSSFWVPEVAQVWTRDVWLQIRTVNCDLYIKVYLHPRNYLLCLMWCKYGQVTPTI